MSDEKFEWKCPRPGCKKQIIAYTERGMRLLAEDHEYKHTKEDYEKKTKEAAEAQKEPPQPMPEKNYNILKLTRVDIGFLRTRHIKIDENIELDPGDK